MEGESYEDPNVGDAGRFVRSSRTPITAMDGLLRIHRHILSLDSDSAHATSEHLPVFSLKDDSVFEIEGEPTGVHKAVELIASPLQKFLVHHSIIGVFEMQMRMPNLSQPGYADALILGPSAWFSDEC
ncbi:hypothetical protein REPUB_Repub12eG0108300 [Reevesia pubescens]